MTVTNEHDAPVLLSVRHRTGLIELNRPKALNSLTPEMIDIITKALRMWGPDDDIDQVVVFSSHPKAFCAGGDVRHARSEVLEGGDPDSFFEAEYALNAALSEFPKPYIAVLDGVAMGGGLGISLHGSHRIVTDKAFASMPEMAIGYVTDVGVPYMSQRTMSPALAKFWGVTGYRMYAADLLYTGLATGYTEDPTAFIEDVVAHGISSAQLSHAAARGPAPLAALAPAIEEAFAHSTWPEILAACTPELRELVDELTAAASPTSIVAALELYDFESRAADIREALAAELRLGTYLIRQPDFAEGVRAVLVDKSKDAAFSPATVEDVDVAALRAQL
ncbi:3-hydroxyisobutyryl-CoA hydrolase [Corynebacterium sp. SA-MJD20WY100]|uniref:3-hydroxyisobutyryl-CoA hydrolase n=1 Tax=Corynebacterium sp. SA-MJD20WY100 TaxID=3142969 RepID=UPI003221C716